MASLIQLIRQRASTLSLARPVPRVLALTVRSTSRLPAPLAGYLDTIRAVPARWKVLIVDQHTQHMLQSVLSTYDVLEEGIQRESRHSSGSPLRSLVGASPPARGCDGLPVARECR